MAKPRPRTRSTFAHNLKLLFDDAGDSCRSLSKRSGISPKQVNNILEERSAPTTESADALARAYGLRAWMLMVRELNLSDIKSLRVARMVDAYLDSSPEAQQYLLSVAERESRASQH